MGIACSKCGHLNPDDAAFCIVCGSALSRGKVCPQCGFFDNTESAAFCVRCGASLSSLQGASRARRPRWWVLITAVGFIIGGLLATWVMFSQEMIAFPDWFPPIVPIAIGETPLPDPFSDDEEDVVAVTGVAAGTPTPASTPSLGILMTGTPTTAPLVLTPLPTTRSGHIDIEIVNESPDDICYVLISPSGSDLWGDDQLDGEEVIGPGKVRAFSMPWNTWDVRVETCDEAAMATAWEVERDISVKAGYRGADTRLLVSNESELELCYIYISPSRSDDWGDDWLGDMETLPDGGLRVFYLKPDIYDMQVADCDGEVLTEEYEINTTEDLYWTLNPQGQSIWEPLGTVAGFGGDMPLSSLVPKKSTPVPTTPPATETPSPTLTPTPTPCSHAVADGFAVLWEQQRGALGCALAAPRYQVWMAVEPFRRGRMLWREDDSRVYVLYNHGTWTSYADLWHEGAPTYSCGTELTPPTPMRGFGKIWCSYDVVRDGLGEATAVEVGQYSTIQSFTGGQLVLMEGGGIYLLSNDGHWSLH